MHQLDGELCVEAVVAGVTIDDAPLAVGEIEAVAPGARIALAGEVFAVACPPGALPVSSRSSTPSGRV